MRTGSPRPTSPASASQTRHRAQGSGKSSWQPHRANLYIVKITLGAKERTVKRNLYSVKIDFLASFRGGAKRRTRIWRLSARDSPMCNCTSEVRAHARPGMTVHSRRTNPIAVKAVGNAMAELHQRYGSDFHVGGVEYREIAAVFTRAPDHGQEPAVALGCIIATRDEHRLGDGVAGRQQIFAEARSPAI